MRDIIFRELRDCHRAIGRINDETERESGSRELIATIDKIYELYNIGMTEGLLALEMAMNSLEGAAYEKYLKPMVMLIIDGTEPERMEEISIARYFSADLSGYDALQYLLMLFGCNGIQCGERISILEEMLVSLMPEDAFEIYNERKLKMQKENENSDIFKRCYEGGIIVPSDDKFYLQIKLVDNAIKAIDDEIIRVILNKLDQNELLLAMRGLSGWARRRLLTNMPEKRAVELARGLENMGPCRMEDIADCMVKIFSMIVNLVSADEVAGFLK